FTANTSGYNLLGNPYPSYVDPSLINWPVNLNQAIYFKDGWSESYWSWVGGIGPNIPPAQGFFVKAIGDGILTFTGAERVHDSISNGELAFGEKLLSLKVINQENQLFDLTYIRFKEESTLGFDQQWDAYKMFTESPVVPQLYTKSNEDDLSINTIPEASSVPLFFTCRQSGNFTIETSQEENFDEVYLEDLLTGEMNDLLEENYSFNYTSGENQERFVVHFNQTKINEYLNEEINIWLDKNIVNIYLPDETIGTVIVYDLIGHRIIEQNLKPNSNMIQLDVPTGVYLTKVVTSHISKSKILFLKSTY
ncbi:MAG: T9SS type A sorting domain-containing protein, partial [Bacteroidales bacterium]|nr:T9SS type A sorting domain-containing protein [Bacteroidales bacterium]